MSLRNLNEIAIKAQKAFQKYNNEEVILTDRFKQLYSREYYIQSEERIRFSKYTTCVKTSKDLTITFPNQWFYTASYFVEFLMALKEYKEIFNLIFNNDTNTKALIKEIKISGEIPNTINRKIKSTLTDSIDIEYFKIFLTHYEWWFGNKTIDTNNYFVSPILRLANVVNVTQSYIADLTYNLSFSSGLVIELKNSVLAEYSENTDASIDNSTDIDFDFNVFIADLKASGLLFSQKTVGRLVASLATKPFVILSGLSGSGKTKLAQAFTKWICQDDSQICIIPVGADWTNREPLLGYPNALQPDNYIKPDNGALDLIIKANNKPDLPHFLILDEMNLSHVERYFSDFLSVMESHEDIALFPEENVISNIPSNLKLPRNLFIIGTVNIDETTYMFSPKVLDRANAIEFRVSKKEMHSYFENNQNVNMTSLNTKGASMAKSFLNMVKNEDFGEQDMSKVHETLINFFEQLKKMGAEFGYRSASEIIRLYNQLAVIDPALTKNEKIDIAIMQKLLPKLHGSRRKLCPILLVLAKFCVSSKIKNIEKEVFGDDSFDFLSVKKVNYPLSLEKITRMYHGAVDNGFASYAEA